MSYLELALSVLSEENVGLIYEKPRAQLVRDKRDKRDKSAKPPSDLRGAILSALAGERLTALALSLRLGVPRDPELYAALGDLLDAKVIGTDPTSGTFVLRETAR